eukprot:g2879.t1
MEISYLHRHQLTAARAIRELGHGNAELQNSDASILPGIASAAVAAARDASCDWRLTTLEEELADAKEVQAAAEALMKELFNSPGKRTTYPDVSPRISWKRWPPVAWSLSVPGLRAVQPGTTWTEAEVVNWYRSVQAQLIRLRAVLELKWKLQQDERHRERGAAPDDPALSAAAPRRFVRVVLSSHIKPKHLHCRAASTSAMAAPTRYDVVVVGAGSGGLTAAKTAARFGAKTMLVERLPRLGGDCTWFGCVPSKALIRCAHAFHEARSKAQLLGVEGIETEKLQCNWQKVKEHIKSCQDFIYKEDDSPEVLETAGVTVRVGCHASFLDSKTIQLTSGDTGAEPVETVFAEHFILCTGASPVLPPVKGLEDVAQAMQRFGVQVTLVGKLMPREDEDEGITVVAARADSVERVEGGGLLLRAGDRELRCAALLVAAGRRPQNLEKLKLERAQVRWTKESQGGSCQS